VDFDLRVFISSTSVDLVEYRQAADRAIRALGATSDDMILWSADERDASAVSVDRVRQCDIVILIVAHRYGFVPDGAEYSVTEQEYRAARSAGIPVFAFLLDENVPWPPKFIERDRPADLVRFRESIEKDVHRKLFRSPDELSRLITEALVASAGRGKAGRSRRLSPRTARTRSVENTSKRESTFEEKVLSERFSLVAALSSRLQKVATTLNRLRHGQEAPDGFMRQNEIVPLTEIFEDLNAHRFVLGTSLHSLFLEQAQLLLRLANTASHDDRQKIAEEWTRNLEVIHRESNTALGVGKIE
jgi:hypothetical protein